MAIEWLAGNRLRGTTAERPEYGLPSGSVGGWKEIARGNASGSSTSFDISWTEDKRYYMILANYNISSGNGNPYLRLNGDTTQKYDLRHSMNGAADSTGLSNTDRGWYAAVSGYNTLPYFEVNYFGSISTKEKIGIGNTVHQNTAGSGTSPNRAFRAMKHVQTSDPITSVNYWNQSGNGNFSSDSEVVVLGWDPDDTHTTNFWEELASVDVTTGTTISTGNFTAKKYLWVQFYLDASAISFDWQFNSSTDTQTSTYSGRHQNNGIGASGQNSDYTQINKNVMAENFGLNASPHFGNMFILNNASNEKLVTGNLVNQNTAGASDAPNRAEFAYKWTNTTNQINNITMLNSVNVSRFIMKVWGAD